MSGPPAIIAVQAEAAALLRRVTAMEQEETRPFALWRAQAADRELLIVACGVGKVNAALATQAVIERRRPAVILSCGSAGGLLPEMQAGDLVIGERAIQHDAGAHIARRYRHVGVQMQHEGRPKTRRIFQADQTLVQLAREAAGATARVGVIASGDQVVFSDERRIWLRKICDALAVDMESAAVAQVAEANGMPWLAIRSISDAADEEAGFDVSRLVEYIEDGAAATLARRLAYLAAHPAAAAKLARLRAGVRLAAERAAELTMAVALKTPA